MQCAPCTRAPIGCNPDKTLHTHTTPNAPGMQERLPELTSLRQRVIKASRSAVKSSRRYRREAGTSVSPAAAEGGHHGGGAIVPHRGPGGGGGIG